MDDTCCHQTLGWVMVVLLQHRVNVTGRGSGMGEDGVHEEDEDVEEDGERMNSHSLLHVVHPASFLLDYGGVDCGEVQGGGRGVDGASAVCKTVVWPGLLSASELQ